MTDARDTLKGRGGGATRGFLFSDLRGYTAFVDQRGAQAGADLLDRYRALVRAAVARHDGAEVRTEGDSFYVVFPSVSGALRCALEIVEAAGRAAGSGVAHIDVGVGVHAGETIETSEGYVGQAVNIAARLCALAAPGEVLVSDTVRSLTQGVSDVELIPRGRRRLKGVSEPVAVFACRPPTAGTSRRRPARPFYARPMVVVGGAIAIVTLLGAAALAMRPAIVPRASWTIGLSMPVSGEMGTYTEPLVRAVELALAETRAAAGVAGSQIVLDVRDHTGGEFGEDPSLAATNAAALVADEGVVAMVGPLQSDIAAPLIPVTNEAGLLQCGASTTDPKLTRPEAGALLLRAAEPDRINFIRLPAPADVEARAVASFAFHDLAATSALVIDDTRSVGGGLADGFQREFEALGGSAVRRALNPGADPTEVLAPLSAADAPQLVFFGGFTNTGAAGVRQAMVRAGHGDLPFLGWDGLFDGSGEEQGSFIRAAGSAAAGSYVSHPSVGTVTNEFERAYRDAHGPLPEGGLAEYAAAFHACVEIILDALTAVLPRTAVPADVREAVRAYVVDPGNQFETVIGPVSFDENGDSVRQLVTFYRVDPDAAGGAGDWQFIEQQDFGPGR